MTAAEILAAAGLAESHWGKRIVSAERRGRFTRGDVRDALGWPTCACGGLDSRISRAADGAPRDGELAWLGSQFFGAVRVDDVSDAAKQLVAIERRAAELLAEAAP